MKIEINFELYPDFQNCGYKDPTVTCFKIFNPEIEMVDENFDEFLIRFLKKYNIDYNHLDFKFFKFHQYINKVFFEITLRSYDFEENKIIATDFLEDLILGIIQELGMVRDNFSCICFTDEINVKLNFSYGETVFFNKYKFHYKLINKTEYTHWLTLEKSIGESEGKLTRFKTFLKKNK